MPKRLIAILALVAYSTILIVVVVFKGTMPGRPPGQRGPPTGETREVIIRWGANFVPFTTILPQLRGEPRWSTAIINLVGNTVLFAPVGFLIPLIHRKLTWPKSLAIAVAVGVMMEGMEWLFHVGIVDVDDVILNALGVMIGYWMFTFPRRRSVDAAAGAPA